MKADTVKFPLKTMVEVDWIDSCTRGPWDTKENYEKSKPLQCRSAGYLCKKSKTEIVLIQNQTSLGSVADSMTIPRSCVTKIRRLK